MNRKLAATVKDDDELAGVLAHEIGHIASHQFVFEDTVDMKRLLHVTSVGDKKDVYAKVQELIDAQIRERKDSDDDSDAKQYEADRIGVYLLAAAGYRPAAMPEWWDRVFGVKGKTGHKLGDLFGVTTLDQKRLRGMRQTAAGLPAGCLVRAATADETAEFQQWQKRVIETRARYVASAEEKAHDLKLSPPLPMEVKRVRFSPDGKYLLAQDDASIHVLSTSDMRVMFSADAEDADPAWFSPNSARVTFTTPGLHTEEWSIAEGKMLAAHELVAKDRCLEARLSPDGRTLVCLSFDRDWYGEVNDAPMLNLSLLDTTTGNVVWEKKPFFEPTRQWAFWEAGLSNVAADRLYSSFSADGNFLLIGPDIFKIAIDLRTRTPISIGAALRDAVTGPYAFVGNDRIAGEGAAGKSDSGIYSFPAGKRLQKMDFLLPTLVAVADPGDKALVVSNQIPPKNRKEEKDKTDVKVHLADLNANASLIASHSYALDVWKNDFATEGPDGSIFLGKMDDGDGSRARKVPLVHDTLGSLADVAVSPDGRLLAFSTSDRSGVWDLQTGRRILLQHPFINVRWTTNRVFYAEFPKSTEYEHKVVEFDMSTGKSRELDVTLDDDTRMRWGYLTKAKKTLTHAELTVYRLQDNSVAWTRTFPDAVPNVGLGTTGVDFILTFPMSSASAKEIVSADQTLQTQPLAMHPTDRARLVQAVDAESGKIIAQAVVEIPRDYAGVRGIDYAQGMIFVGGDSNRTLVFSAKTGTKAWQTFGRVLATDRTSGLSCVLNRRDELTVYDTAGQAVQHLRTAIPIRFVQFLKGAQKLVVLMADQTVRVVDVAAETALAER